MKTILIKKTVLAMVVGLLSTQAAQAEISDTQLDLAAAELQPQVVEWRRWFHTNPELSNREVNTAKHIVEILTNMGLKPQTGIAHTGIIAMIQGGLPGPLVAIRTDIDALPVVEQTGLEFASIAKSEYNDQEVGVMHACGHDNHMAMVLGAAKILNDMKAQLQGSVMLIFQPAEEGPPAGEEGGASMMLDEGIFKDRTPDAVFGMHVGIGIPGGQFAVKPGPLMAAADTFKLTVRGKQTHGARPWDGVDPIVVTSQIIMAFQTIASRQVDVTKAPSIISVGRIDGGVRFNVIPDQVVLEGTVRTFDPDMRDYIHSAMERTARLIAESARAEAELEMDKSGRAVVNDDALTAEMIPVLARASGKPVLSVLPQTVAEDFSEYGEFAPSLFVFLGNWEASLDPTTQPTNHSPYFDMYEPYLETGVKGFTYMVVNYMKDHPKSDK